MKKPLATARLTASLLAIVFILSSFSLVFDKELISATYGYGYGTSPIEDKENSPEKTDFGKINLKINKNQLTGKKTTSKESVKLSFEDVDDKITHYKISQKSDLAGARWEKIDDSLKLNLKNEKQGKVKFYVRFKDGENNVSQPFEKTINYKPAVKNKLAISKDKTKAGETLIQRGKGFKKNAQVRVYFSKTDGTYYPPTIVKTDQRGNFILTYKVQKPAGTYHWYAVNEASGVKSKISTYSVGR